MRKLLFLIPGDALVHKVECLLEDLRDERLPARVLSMRVSDDEVHNVLMVTLSHEPSDETIIKLTHFVDERLKP